MTTITEHTIESIGTEIRGEAPQITGQCHKIASHMQNVFKYRFDVHLDVVELRIGEIRDTHFVNKFDAEEFDSPLNDDVLIDASLDQFCTENQDLNDIRVDLGPRKTIPSVGIFEPGDEERHVWYYKPNDPHEGLDVFSGKPTNN